MDWQMLFVSAAVQALVGGGISFLFWMFLQRQVEKYDRLRQRVDHLEEKRVTAIETDAKDESEKNAARRKEIYERLGAIEKTAVTMALCREQHKALMESLEEYRAAVIDLAKVQENVTSTAKFVDEVNERVISLKEDVARMQGVHQGEKEGVTHGPR